MRICWLVLLVLGANGSSHSWSPQHLLPRRLAVSARAVPTQAHAFSKSLQLQRSLQLTPQRALLRNGTLPLHGSVEETGFFYADLLVGTPGQHFTLIVDTGSTISFVPCSNCTECGPYHDNPFFDPALSTTSSAVGCADPACVGATFDCRDNGTAGSQSCWYDVRYAEGSTSEGWLMHDVFTFPDSMLAGQQAADNRSTASAVAMSPSFAFGCGLMEGGLIYDQAADGILAMARSNDSFHGQLSGSGVMSDTFGLCFGTPAGGTMILGAVPALPTMTTQWTTLRTVSDSTLYHVDLQGVTLAGRLLNVAAGIYSAGRLGAVLDTGTAYTFLPDSAYAAFLSALEALAAGRFLPHVSAPDPGLQPPDVCWGNASLSHDSLGDFFPEGEFLFAGARLRLRPWQYLFRHLGQAGAWCLAMYPNGPRSTIVGAVTLRDTLVTFDEPHTRVGFAEVPPALGGCVGLQSELAKAAAAATPAAAAALPPPLPPPGSPPAALHLLPPPRVEPPPPSAAVVPSSQPQLLPERPLPPWPLSPSEPPLPPHPSSDSSPSGTSLPSPPPVSQGRSVSTMTMVLGVAGAVLVGGALLGAVVLCACMHLPGSRRWSPLQQQDGDSFAVLPSARPLQSKGAAQGSGGSSVGAGGGGFVSRDGQPFLPGEGAQYQLQPPLCRPPLLHPPPQPASQCGGGIAADALVLISAAEAHKPHALPLSEAHALSLPQSYPASAPAPATLLGKQQRQPHQLLGPGLLRLRATDVHARHDVELVPLVVAAYEARELDTGSDDGQEDGQNEQGALITGTTHR